MSFNKPTGYSLSRDVSPPPPGSAEGATAYLPRVEPGRWFGMLARRAWVLALSLALAVGGTAIYLKKATRIYEAKGSVYVSSRTPRMVETGVVAPEETRELEQMRSVEQGLVSSTLLSRVIDAGKLDDDPVFRAGTASRGQLIEAFGKRVKVELRRGTRLIDIAVQDPSPGRAKDLVGSLVSEYERWSAERQGDLTRQVAEGIGREEEALRARMERSERMLQEFREANPVPGVGGKNGPGAEDLGRIEAELTKAKADRMRLEAEVAAFRTFDPNHPESAGAWTSAGQAAGVMALARAVEDKEIEFARIKERYLEKHPNYIEVSNELAALKANLQKAARAAGETLDNNYRIALDQEAKLGREVGRARHDVVSAEGLRAKFEALEREAVADRTLHETVASRLRETTLATSVPGPVLRWEDLPMVPDKPVKPHKSVLLALASFAGLFFGLTIAVGVELADGRVRDTAAAARATGVPLLASVAGMSDGKGGDFALLSQPDSETSEAFRRLRAALSPPAGHNGPTTVLFASAKAGEGRSFCAMNHAASLAIQGLRTLLIDADMRSPGLSLQHMQSPDGQVGLGDYLAGRAEPANACHPTMLPNLYLLSSGVMQPNAAELLSGTRFPALLEDAYRWFDCVVIDSPPLLATSDALAITRYADRTCLVVRELASDRRELKRAADLIRTSGGSLVGFVWNQTPQKSRSGHDAGPSLPVFRPLLAGSATDMVVPGPRLQKTGLPG